MITDRQLNELIEYYTKDLDYEHFQIDNGITRGNTHIRLSNLIKALEELKCKRQEMKDIDTYLSYAADMSGIDE